MAKRRRGRVHGPYQERAGWRVVVVPLEGERTSEVCESEADALQLLADLRAELGAKDATVSEAIDEYLAWKADPARDRPLKPGSVVTLRFRLKGMFEPEYDRLVGDITPRVGQALYDQLRAKTRQRVDTHRNTLAAGKAFLAWCAARGYAGGNALAGVVGVGERAQGKEQLRVDEARAFMTLAVKLAKEGDLGALAAVTLLVVGIRAGECAAIVARDIDDGGRVLVIPKSKTKAGVRRMVMPRWLGRLLKAAADPETGAVFPGRDRHWVHYHGRRICRLADVPEVTAHGLRGTHATLAIDGGASADVVAATLGHTNVRITQRHYTKAEATDAARGRRAQDALRGGRS